FGKRVSSAVEIDRFERPLDACDLRKEARVFGERRRELHVQVGRSRTVHARDLHVAAEWDRSNPVFDAVAHHLHQRRRETEVKAARPHANATRNEEVAGLVQEDQKRKTEDGDEDAHATLSASPTWRRAASSAVTSSSRSRAADPSVAASPSATAPPIPRNGRRPARNAATATSFAALNAQGYVPPRSPAVRACESSGNVCRSGGSNSSVMPPARSSGGIGVALRSGYVRA